MVKYLITPLLLALLAGCADIAEYDSTVATGVNVYSAADLSYLGDFASPSDAMSMLIRNDCIYFACSDGYFRGYDLDTGELTGEVVIGVESPSGYRDMVLNPLRNSVYVLTTMGAIAEVDIPGCVFIDELEDCVSPVEMEITTGDPGFLWVLDGHDNSIRQFRLDTNGYCGHFTLPQSSTVTTLATSIYSDSMFVGTIQGVYKLSTMGPGSFRCERMRFFVNYIHDATAIPGDSNFVVVADTLGEPHIGEAWIYADSTGTNPPPYLFRTEPLEGSYFFTGSAGDPDWMYAVSSTLNGSSVLSAYRTGHDHGIKYQTELPGNPLDMDFTRAGEIYVLTYE
ncbi:hypothetical protein CSA37_08820 [Candidatus Fermentibacteria bacterium]|nr:MAG: hypothetical protein CSA37_08820 [Candidatus Fermentibacteria bacterium]